MSIKHHHYSTQPPDLRTRQERSPLCVDQYKESATFRTSHACDASSCGTRLFPNPPSLCSGTATVLVCAGCGSAPTTRTLDSRPRPITHHIGYEAPRSCSGRNGGIGTAPYLRGMYLGRICGCVHKCDAPATARAHPYPPSNDTLSLLHSVCVCTCRPPRKSAPLAPARARSTWSR